MYALIAVFVLDANVNACQYEIVLTPGGVWLFVKPNLRGLAVLMRG